MDRIGAVMLMLFGSFWVWQASRLSTRQGDAGPGPAVLPMSMGTLIILLAVISFLRPEIRRIELPHFGRIALILASLIGYAVLLEPLGYVISTTILLGFLLLAFAEQRHWWQPVSAFAVSFVTYYIFRIQLAVPLPPDPLDFLR